MAAPRLTDGFSLSCSACRGEEEKEGRREKKPDSCVKSENKAANCQVCLVFYKYMASGKLCCVLRRRPQLSLQPWRNVLLSRLHLLIFLDGRQAGRQLQLVQDSPNVYGRSLTDLPIKIITFAEDLEMLTILKISLQLILGLFFFFYRKADVPKTLFNFLLQEKYLI